MKVHSGIGSHVPTRLNVSGNKLIDDKYSFVLFGVVEKFEAPWGILCRMASQSHR